MGPITPNDLLQAARAASGWTQDEVAERVRSIVERRTGQVRPGFDQRKMSRLERGETRWPDKDERGALRELFGVSEDRDLGFYYRAPAAAQLPPATIDDVNRRELLRLGALVGAAAVEHEAAAMFGGASRGVVKQSVGDLDQWGAASADLWTEYGSAPVKSSTLPAVRLHAGQLVDELRTPMTSARREHLYELTSNTFQLAGEILFDVNDYTDAANCYAVAAHAGRAARHYDLWACSLASGPGQGRGAAPRLRARGHVRVSSTQHHAALTVRGERAAPQLPHALPGPGAGNRRGEDPAV
ncbi:helix-turn-helix transcriptional regulator [Catenulispora sp. NF23]|uniref:helix-turn-helix domain-containing protein n=1 Tax=Catenulispora pinistramenti TaxID=2705254 RepID=UPI001BAB0164|nr:helix-turn-helix transcriptional regulator [Catenulispora pinistramenti]MBS2531786.1 helix-turn-helix transcriptional regulator [Catenulispora pinistramenti]